MECYEARKKNTRNSINVDLAWLSRDMVKKKSVVSNMLPLDNRRMLVGAHNISGNIQKTVVASGEGNGVWIWRESYSHCIPFCTI